MNKLKYAIPLILMAVVLTMGAILETPRDRWNKEGTAAIATDDTLVTSDANGMKYADITSRAYQPTNRHNSVEVTWVMGADGQSCAVYLFAARDSGDIVLVWNGTVTAGTQQSTSNQYYVDTLASTTDNWITTIGEIDVAGSNRMSRIVLDTCGYRYFFCQYTGLSSESIRAYYSGY